MAKNNSIGRTERTKCITGRWHIKSKIKKTNIINVISINDEALRMQMLASIRPIILVLGSSL
jgi:hypothetical protein